MTFKFFLVPADYPKGAYHHEMVAICEGLRELGVQYYGTLNYWIEPERGNYLIQEAPSDFKADVHIYSGYYFDVYPNEIINVDLSKINIVIDREDGYYSLFCEEKYKTFDLILKTHYNKNINYKYYHHNIKPWAFGLSNRIMSSIDKTTSVPLENKVYINFRVEQDVRRRAYEEFTPIITRKYPVDDVISLQSITERPFAGLAVKEDQIVSELDLLYRKQTGNRHDQTYFNKLNSSLLTFAFGGFIAEKPFMTTRLLFPFKYMYRAGKLVAKVLKIDTSHLVFIYQYDSWRWWEALYSNTCPIHMDFKDWDWVLPEMPEAGVHYWGVRNFNFKMSAEKLLATEREAIIKIGQRGREWAAEHYSSLATSRRFLKLIDAIYDKRKIIVSVAKWK